VSAGRQQCRYAAGRAAASRSRFARLEIGRLAAERQHGAMTAEIGFEVGNPAMVDIGVGRLEPPVARIVRPARPHVLVDAFLQIDAALAVGTDDDVRADATIRRDIAAGIGQLAVTAILEDGDADLLLGSGGQARIGVGRSRSSDQKQCEESDSEHTTPPGVMLPRSSPWATSDWLVPGAGIELARHCNVVPIRRFARPSTDELPASTSSR